MFLKLKTLLSKLKSKTRSSEQERQPEWTVIKTIKNADDTRRLEILTGPTQTYKYQSSKWVPANACDKGRLGEGYWNYLDFSGHYETAESCETDAREAIFWLHEMSCELHTQSR